MACVFNLNGMLTDNLDEDAATITEILRQTRELLAKDRELASKVPNVITEKRDQARIKTLLKYSPHIETIDLFEQFHEAWLKDPALFDEYVISPQWAAMDPWTRSRPYRRISCLAMARIMKDHDHLRQCTLVNTDQLGLPMYDEKTLNTAVNSMLDAASHYENWKIGLGVSGGVALCLGSAYAETSWTKLVGKKGSNYDEVIQRLKEVDFPRHAEKFAELEKALVNQKVKILLTEAQLNLGI